VIAAAKNNLYASEGPSIDVRDWIWIGMYWHAYWLQVPSRAALIKGPSQWCKDDGTFAKLSMTRYHSPL